MSLDTQGCTLQLDWCIEEYNSDAVILAEFCVWPPKIYIMVYMVW